MICHRPNRFQEIVGPYDTIYSGRTGDRRWGRFGCRGTARRESHRVNGATNDPVTKRGQRLTVEEIRTTLVLAAVICGRVESSQTCRSGSGTAPVFVIWATKIQIAADGRGGGLGY